MENEKCVCPSSLAPTLDNFIRKWIHNPVRIYGKYIKEGMTIIDLGCGPGFFVETFALLAGNGGTVIAADLQEEMLEKVRKKIKGKVYENRMKFHKCEKDTIGINTKADFVNAFYMVHEVPSSGNLINEIYSLLNKDGIFFLTEPKVHVPKKEFNHTVSLAEKAGFKIIDHPKIHISRSAVFVKEQ